MDIKQKITSTLKRIDEYAFELEFSQSYLLREALSEIERLEKQAMQHAGAYADELEKLAVEIETLKMAEEGDKQALSVVVRAKLDIEVERDSLRKSLENSQEVIRKIVDENRWLRKGAENVHDRLLRGDDDIDLLGMLTKLYSV